MKSFFIVRCLYMPSEPHGEGDIAVELLEKIRARRKMMPSGV